jgi:hypothetical protein
LKFVQPWPIRQGGPARPRLPGDLYRADQRADALRAEGDAGGIHGWPETRDRARLAGVARKWHLRAIHPIWCGSLRLIGTGPRHQNYRCGRQRVVPPCWPPTKPQAPSPPSHGAWGASLGQVMQKPKCTQCDGVSWVCETHLERPLGREPRLPLRRCWRAPPGL